jgi:hypothetical protein
MEGSEGGIVDAIRCISLTVSRNTGTEERVEIQSLRTQSIQANTNGTRGLTTAFDQDIAERAGGDTSLGEDGCIAARVRSLIVGITRCTCRGSASHIGRFAAGWIADRNIAGHLPGARSLAGKDALTIDYGFSAFKLFFFNIKGGTFGESNRAIAVIPNAVGAAHLREGLHTNGRLAWLSSGGYVRCELTIRSKGSRLRNSTAETDIAAVIQGLIEAANGGEDLIDLAFEAGAADNPILT